MFRRRIAPVVAALCMISLIPACSEKLAKRTGLTAQDLYSLGQQKQAAKKYEDAGEAYQLLLERFPNSPLAPKAQLAMADAKMDDKEDLEAEVAFSDFLRLYPADDNVHYALYRKGELLARQTADPGRDQSKTVEAIKSLTLAREKNPAGPYSAKAGAMIAELRNRLAKHEKLIVVHYIGRKRYESAEVRARRALSEYPETASAHSLMDYLAVALEKQGKQAEAAEVRKTMAEKFPSQEKKP